ncbi:Lrp/AsnC family transcriptional regulator [Paralcaligenes sp. KSB-10]|uniref:Lrp/AsnC family transcriptional regulator n=1 Tax=Paralcaligenes sp. KSB-10 TaxID=2901142 RepID=UPI001E39143B|nr:Lrp/AsnC family transcriptional regulator [Paralcaligenes sp. KSB-10]UHL64615.1 Lrp/AsnC family transcriptional regulator [Paralcaligenes sp. KSB-10]
MELDAINLRILVCLQEDGRISNQDLADKVALSPSACLRRLRALEESGVIQGYHVALDNERLGVEIEAFVQVSMREDEEGWHDRFIDEVRQWPEVSAIYIVTGESNYLLRVQARSLKQYTDFIVNKLHRTHGVMDIRSNMVLQKVKETPGGLALIRS